MALSGGGIAALGNRRLFHQLARMTEALRSFRSRAGGDLKLRTCRSWLYALHALITVLWIPTTQAQTLQITGFKPDIGPVGTSVTVSGSGFVGVTGVAFNGVAADFKASSGTLITATVPAGAATGPISVAVLKAVVASKSAFVVVMPPPSHPMISGVSPDAGGPGTKVTIIGVQLAGLTTVLFNSIRAEFVANSESSVTAVVPAGASTGPITLLLKGVQLKSPSDFKVTVLPGKPGVDSLANEKGAPGEILGIVGSYLEGTTAVLFNGVTKAAFVVRSSTEIQATVPDGASSGAVLVIADGVSLKVPGTFTVIPRAQPPIIAAFEPASGAVGTQVILKGTGFGADSVVAVNGEPGVGVSVGPGKISFLVPEGAATGMLSVSNAAGVAVSATPFGVPVADVPLALEGFEPAKAKVGAEVRLRGSGLGGVTAVDFNGGAAAFEQISANEIKAIVPAKAVSGRITVVSPAEKASSAAAFVVDGPGSKPAPIPRLVATGATVRDGGEIVFSFPTAQDHGYRVEAMEALGTDSWGTYEVFPPSPDSPSAGFRAPALAGPAQRFFRVTADPLVYDNWDFEWGLVNWTATGRAFEHQPTYGDAFRAGSVRPVTLGGDYWNTSYPVGQHGDYWVCTGQDHTGADSPLLPDISALESLTGTLTSRPFRVGSPYLSFLIGGDNDLARLRVELELLPRDAADRTRLPAVGSDGEYVVVLFGTGRGTEVMRREVWDLGPWQGYLARVRIVDQSATGHINVDDFRFPGTDPRAELLATSAGYRDRGAEVWGFADTHTHPASYLAFGGKLISGRPDGDMAVALRSCEAEHGAGGTGICPFGDCVGNAAFAFFENGLGHRTGGYEHGFDGWPSFTSLTHEQMYVDWVRRAWQGGLRLMVAHVVNTEYLAHEFGGRIPFDDVSAVESQIQAIKELAARHPDFMEIAYGPGDARRIIHENRLALVLGVEEDTLGGFRREEAATHEAITQYLQHLWELGVRHLFPIHLANNAFGGCAIYEDDWNLNNRYLRGNYLPVEQAPEVIQFRLAENESLPVQIMRINPLRVVGGLIVGLVGAPALPFPGIEAGGWVGAATGGGFYDPPDYASMFAGHGHINAFHLTEPGRHLISEMMRLGLVIDIDHMGANTKWDVLHMVSSNRYPVISGHCGFTDLAWRRGETAATGKLASEGDPTAELLEAYRGVGAMVSPITLLKDVRPWGTRVANDCAGSSKSWAQAYLYAVEKQGGRNVGLGTDFGLVMGAAPRFGLNAAYALNDGPHGYEDSLRHPLAANQAGAQSNGVRYDRPIRDYRAYRFAGPRQGDVYDEDQALFWQAIAIFKSGATPESAEQPWERPLWLHDKVVNIAKGFYATSPDQLLQPGILTGDSPWEQRAAYLTRIGVDPTASGAEREEVRRIYAKLQPVWARWVAMESGDNPPLQRCLVGPVRDYDINLDGMAHFGLLPDFLQDLRNVGLSSDDLKPLFRSAEDYIRLWERCQR